MRSSALILLFITLLCNTSWSQDIITKTNGDKISAKVLKVTPTEIEYKLYNNQDGPLHTMDKSEILLITYTNGTKEEFNTIAEPAPGMTTLAQQGEADAKKYYRGYKTAMTWSGVSAIYPFYGTIAVAVISSTRPKYESLNFPSRALMEKEEYKDAYMRKAFRMKSGHAWAAYGIGTGILASVILGIVIGTSGGH